MCYLKTAIKPSGQFVCCVIAVFLGGMDIHITRIRPGTEAGKSISGLYLRSQLRSLSDNLAFIITRLHRGETTRVNIFEIFHGTFCFDV